MDIELGNNEKIKVYENVHASNLCGFEKYRDILDYEGRQCECKDPLNLDRTLHHAFQTFAKTLAMQKIDKTCFVIVSLSGGVDSMICSLLSKAVWGPERVVCAHVNYANRDTADMEEQFVRDWCAHLGLTLYVRKIDEINRPDCMTYDMREMYETYTKCVRMDLYRKTMRGCKCIVLMGHNKDDCFENILTNIAGKTKYDNLEGMQMISECDGMCFGRPLLGIEKKDIVHLARECGVPYLYDSTPKWSQRGKIRDNVLPCINSWHPDAVDGFFHMSTRMKEMWQMMKMGMTAWEGLHQLVRSENLMTFICTRAEMPCEVIFWRTLMNVQIKTKSILHLVDEITRWKDNKHSNNTSSKGKIILNVHLAKMTHLYILGFGNTNLVVISAW
jgi:tRNA(Ile)-lysidine synthetase-like protein